MANMYLVCGISGSGKTTYSRQFAEEHNLLRLDIDEFYAKVNGDECDRRNKFEVWIEFFKAIHEAEINNVDCVIETAGLTRYQRREFIEWFPTFQHHLIFVEATKALRELNNVFRNRRVPQWRMDQMAKIVENPDAVGSDNLFDSIRIIENLNNNFAEPRYLKGDVKTSN